MRRTSLSAVATAVALLAVPLAPPAAAHAVIKIECIVHPVSGDCTVTGEVNGTTVVSASATLNYSATIDCPLSTASGTMSGALNLSLNWTRIAAGGVITTTGDVNGFGPMVFSAPCPAPAESVTILLVALS